MKKPTVGCVIKWNQALILEGYIIRSFRRYKSKFNRTVEIPHRKPEKIKECPEHDVNYKEAHLFRENAFPMRNKSFLVLSPTNFLNC